MFDPFFRLPKGTLPWQPILGKIGKPTFILHPGITNLLKYHKIDERLYSASDRSSITPALGALELENELQYHGLAMRVNNAYDPCISCKNFVKFSPVTPELTGLICERLV